MATPAIKLTRFTLELSSSPMMGGIGLSLMERQTKMLNKAQMVCRDYAMDGDYEDCARTFISSQLIKDVNCSLPGMKNSASLKAP